MRFALALCIGLNCLDNNVEKCSSCSLGYHLDNNNNCKENSCTCDNGSGETGASCEIHATEKCSNCNTGYSIMNDVCIEHVCACINGPAYSGAECPVDGAQGCESCNQGWTHLKLPSGDACECDTGYNKQAGVCVENVCHCSSGNGATEGAYS